MSTVRIPADIDQEDRLMAGLTARQLVILAVPTVIVWLAYFVTRNVIPLVAFAPAAVIIAGTAGALVVSKRDGVTMDRFALAALRHHRSPRTLVMVADESIALPPALAPLGLPIVGIDADGVVDLGALGCAVLLRASAINLALQNEQEQEATTAAFGRYCNSLHDSVQFSIRSEPIDLSGVASDLERRAPGMPALGLERAARDHASFLAELGRRHDVLRRNVLVVLRDKRPIAEAAPQLGRRALDTVSALRVAGVDLAILDRLQVVDALQRSCSPDGARTPIFEDEIVTGVGS